MFSNAFCTIAPRLNYSPMTRQKPIPCSLHGECYNGACTVKVCRSMIEEMQQAGADEYRRQKLKAMCDDFELDYELMRRASKL